MTTENACVELPEYGVVTGRTFPCNICGYMAIVINDPTNYVVITRRCDIRFKRCDLQEHRSITEQEWNHECEMCGMP